MANVRDAHATLPHARIDWARRIRLSLLHLRKARHAKRAASHNEILDRP